MSKEVVIYCDGFLKYNGYEMGCSVAVQKNNKTVYLKRFLFENFSDTDLRTRIMRSGVTAYKMECFAVWNALSVAKKYSTGKNKIIIYSDALSVVQKINGSEDCADPILNTFYEKIRKLKKENIMLLWLSRKANVRILGH